MRGVSCTAAVGLVLGTAALTGCVIDVEGSEAVEEEEHVFAVSGVPDVDLSTFEGPIEVRGWDRPEVRVVVEKRAAGEARLDEIEVDTEQAGNRVRVAARRRDSQGPRITFWMHGRRAKLIASVPRESNLIARTDDGSVALNDLAGTIEVVTDDGRIRGEQLGGSVQVRTDDGSVRLQGVDGDVAAHSEDGSIRVSGALTGLDVSTDDGRVELDMAAGSVMTGDWDVQSADGRVTLRLPRDFSAELDLRTDDGRIRLDDHFGGDADRDAERLQRTIGVGGFVLRVQTDDGSIRVGTS